jgi:hypothetical protein
MMSDLEVLSDNADSFSLQGSEFDWEVESAIKWNIAYSSFYVTRNADFDIHFWLIAEQVLGQVFRTKRAANFRRNVFLCSVYSAASNMHYGYWVPPEEVILTGSRLTFTFFLKGHLIHDISNLSRFSSMYLGNRTYFWRVADDQGDSFFLTVSTSLTATNRFGLANQLFTNLRYLFHAMNLFVYSLFSGRVETPLLPHHNWQNSDIAERIDLVNPKTIISKLRLLSFVPAVRSKPFYDWFYCGDIYLRQPNLLSPKLLTYKSLFYLLGFTVNSGYILLTKDTWNAIITKVVANKISASFVSLVTAVEGSAQIVEGFDERRLTYSQLLALPFFVAFDSNFEHRVLSLPTEDAVLDFMSNIYYWLTLYMDRSASKMQYLLSFTSSIDGVISALDFLAVQKNPLGEPLIDWMNTDL